MNETFRTQVYGGDASYGGRLVAVSASRVRYDKDLSLGARLIHAEVVAAVTTGFDDELPIQEIADLLGITLAQLKNFLKELHERNYIRVTRTPTKAFKVELLTSW